MLTRLEALARYGLAIAALIIFATIASHLRDISLNLSFIRLDTARIADDVRDVSKRLP